MFGRLTDFLVFGLAPLMLATLASPTLAVAEDKIVTGEVLYRERIALPPTAQVEVQLVDISLADAPATIVAKQTIKDGGQVPVQFKLAFDSKAIMPKHTYALQARITVDNQLWFLNDVRHEIEPLTAGPQTILVKMVRESDAKVHPIQAGATWKLEAIDGAKVTGPADLTIEADGKISGMGGCNRFGGQAKIKDQTIAIGDVVATQMACEQTLMELEGRYFASLGKVASFKEENDKLLLLDAEGKELLAFSKAG